MPTLSLQDAMHLVQAHITHALSDTQTYSLSSLANEKLELTESADVDGLTLSTHDMNRPISEATQHVEQRGMLR